jgi:hypothetical protein
MSGYWIAFGWLLASMGFFGLWISRRQKRVDAITYAVVLPGLAVAMLVLAVGQGWQKYQSHTADTQIRNELNDIGSEEERVKGRLQTLQERIRVNKAASEAISQPGNLTPTTDPDAIRSRAEHVAAFQKEASALQEERKAILRDSQALKERALATQSELNDARRASAFRDLLTFVCALAIATLAVVRRVFISRTQRKRIAECNASLRAQGIDPTVPSERVRQLAHAGKKIEAIKVYCEETGTWPQEAKHVVESYLDGRRSDV